MSKVGSTEKASILVVDDNPKKLLSLVAILSHLDLNIVQADSGKEALRRLLNQEFAVMLLDVQMPIMDGFETATMVRQRAKSAQLPIIFVTSAEKSEMHSSRGYSLGAVDYIYSPILPEMLKAKVTVFVELFKKTEEVKQQAQELAKANRQLKETQMHLIQSEKMASLGQLVAGIAHEINNPLAFVLNNLFTVESGMDRIAPEIAPHLSETSTLELQKVRARLTEMKEGLDRVKELVQDLRTFSRLDEGEFKTIDIHESIDSALLFLHHKMSGRIELEKQYGPVGTLSCFAGRLNQVLMNLIANAVDAIENEGKITITTRQTNESVFISVRDTGKGIPEPIRNRIFEPFFTTKPVGQGTGLGLAISYGIIQAHHGAIEVDSQEGMGKGTEFTVRIPLNLETRTQQ